MKYKLPFYSVLTSWHCLGVILLFVLAANGENESTSESTTMSTTTTTTAPSSTTTKVRPLPPRLRNAQILANELRTGLKMDLSSHPHFYLLPNVSECGITANFAKTNRTKRLVGGNYPTLGSFPWAARIELVDGDSGNNTLRCGASLISSRYILTSARCLTGIPSTQTLNQIVLGTTDRRVTFQCAGENETNCVNSTTVDIDDVFIHEEFVKTSAWNDVALIRLSEEVKFSDFVRPICMPTSEDLLDRWKDNKLTVYGWGRQESDDETEPYYYSYNLQSVNISMTTREHCDRVYRRMTGKLDNSRFCAGGDAEKGTCKADTGGAVMKKLKVPIGGNATEEQDRFYQFGVIHFGRCALEGVPSVYVNTLFYMKWILDNMEP